jgi:outer membrane protein
MTDFCPLDRELNMEIPSKETTRPAMKEDLPRLIQKVSAIPLKRHRAIRSLFLLVLSGCVAFVGVPSMAQDLQTAYRQAASTSPIIAQARAQLNAALAGRPLARAALLPHVDAVANGGMNTAHVTGFGAQPISTGYHSDLFSVSLTESLFDGQALAAVKESDSRIQAGEAALAYARQIVGLEVTRAYFGVLRAQANQRVAQRQMDLLQSIGKQTEAKLRVGTGDIISVREVQARLDAAKADLIRATNAVTIAKYQLERLTHHAAGALADVTTLQAIGPQPGVVGPWLATALKSQPLLQQARATLEASEEQIQFAKRARWPTLTLSGIGQHTTGMLIPPLAVNQVGASLNLSIPIYEGGSTGARIRQAEALSEANRAGLASLRDQITLETQTAFHDLEDSVAQFQAAQEAVTSAKVSLDATRKGYEIGSRSIIDLLTSTTDYATAQRNYYLALYAQLVDRTQLKAAAGILTPRDIRAINDLLQLGASH